MISVKKIEYIFFNRVKIRCNNLIHLPDFSTYKKIEKGKCWKSNQILGRKNCVFFKIGTKSYHNNTASEFSSGKKNLLYRNPVLPQIQKGVPNWTNFLLRL